MSVSLASTRRIAAASSFTVALSATALGASLTGVRLRLTTPVSKAPASSVTR